MLGLVAEWRIAGNFYLQPELLPFYWAGAKGMPPVIEDAPPPLDTLVADKSAQRNLSYFEIPVIVKYGALRNRLHLGAVFAQLTPFGLGKLGSEVFDRLSRMREDGSFPDTIITFRSQKKYSGTDVVISPLPFGEGPIWAATNDNHIVMGITQEYELKIFTEYGRLETIIRKHHEKEIFGDRDRGIIEGYWVTGLTRAGRPNSSIQRLLDALNIPGTTRPWSRLLSDLRTRSGSNPTCGPHG